MSAAPPVTLDFLGARVAQLTDEMRDVRQRLGIIEHRLDGLEARFTGLEGRFAALEGRFTAQEQRQGHMLAIIVRLAAAQGISTAE
jgi:hypothetical protein